MPSPPSWIVLLFAHPDDVVLSAFGALTRLAPMPCMRTRGQIVDITVCCGYSRDQSPGEWDRASGFASAVEAVGTRRREQVAATAGLGVTTYALDVPDGQYSDQSPAHWRAAESTVLALASSAKVAAVVSHRKTAEHPDHRRVARIAEAVALAHAAQLVTVCDRPYARCTPAKCAQPPARQGACSRLLLSEHAFALKLRRFSLYASQTGALRHAFGDEAFGCGHLDIECYWQELRR